MRASDFSRRHLLRSLFLFGSLLAGVVVVYYAITYESENAALKSDAEEFCSLYSPEVWQELGEDSSLHGVMMLIMGESEKRLHTDEIKRAIAGSQEKSYPEYHDAVVNRISAVLGEEWECDSFTEFYYPSITVRAYGSDEQVRHRIDLENSGILYIEAVDSKTVMLNRSPLREFSSDLLKRAVQVELEETSSGFEKVIIHFNENVAPSHRDLIFNVLKEISISNIYIVEP
ncbi:MAG: hypothetical protein MI794_15815 [Pseudomonadales bacterium]|nr:hypothetical protein [Pseudomonadales bacterium]